MDKEHILKVCQLLKKKDKNHSQKRKNLAKTEYNFDENNNLYLTLPKFDYGKRIRDLIKEKQLQEELEKLNQENKKTIIEKEIETNRNNLEKLIPEFFQHNNTKSDEDSIAGDYLLGEKEDSEDSVLNEDEREALFEKLKTSNRISNNYYCLQTI